MFECVSLCVFCKHICVCACAGVFVYASMGVCFLHVSQDIRLKYIKFQVSN